MVVVTNTASVFTIPFMLSWIGDLGTTGCAAHRDMHPSIIHAAIHLDVTTLIVKLVLTILVPLIVCGVFGAAVLMWAAWQVAVISAAGVALG